ncbi:12306_t:CDS:2 [Funneliformis geosporum]|uniref:12306_t:CDS:1 n=1 Tax=Funneliformis geosporum TaxID=1117311 RepID=A0A9W4SFT6_9GLOM|nr:12306_t:CDS:2 [Funneliformis geosporum]
MVLRPQSISMHSNNSELFISRLMQDYNLDNECNSHILSQAEQYFSETFDASDDMNVLIDKLIGLIIKTQDEGNNFNETMHFINQCIYLSNHSSSSIFECINFEKNENKAFQLFSRASEDNYPIAQVYLKAAFKICEDLAEQGFDNAQVFLGCLYDNGEGIKKDLNKSIYWYNKAAENKNEIAQYNLGQCYRLGIGIEKNETKAFEYYKLSVEKEYVQSSEKEYVVAQFQLGYCYYNGIGTDINKEAAFILYQTAAEKEYNTGQIWLSYLYEKGEGTEKDLEKANFWYNKSAGTENKLAQYNLGNCYTFGIGVEKDEMKAFKYYKQSADKEFVDAQFQLGYCYENGIGTEINKDEALRLYKIAAEKEHSKSQIILENANFWYKKAAENENEVVQGNFKSLKRNSFVNIKFSSDKIKTSSFLNGLQQIQQYSWDSSVWKS